MTKPTPHLSHRRQHGVSLIEVLVGLTIGLVILGAIGAAYLNSNNLVRQRDDQAQLNEPARIAINMLRSNIANAGYVDIFDLDAANRTQAATIFFPGNATLNNIFVRDPAINMGSSIGVLLPGLVPVFGCDGAMTLSPNDIAMNPPPAALACGPANATRHSLQVAYQGIPNSVNPTNSLPPANTATGVGLDCLQQTAPAGTTLIINRFELADANANEPSRLRCAGSGNAAAQDIAPGVEEFVLRYQMSAPGVSANPQAAGGTQQQYLSATQVAASAQGWPGVTAVEICLVSATDPARGPAAAGTTDLQPTRPTCVRDANGVFLPNIARTAGDARLWKRFTSVVSVRNSVYASPL